MPPARPIAEAPRHRRSTVGSLAALAALVAGGCGGADVDPPPGRLTFETIVTYVGPPVAGTGATTTATTGTGATEAPTRVIEAPTGVIVGAVVGPSISPRSEPSDDGPVVAELSNPTDIGGPLVFQLVDDDPGDLGDEAWIEVRLPIRPNGTTGWVRAGELELSRNPYRIEVDASDHRLEVWREGRPWLETTVGIGTGSTPTPRGDFYIIELLQPPDPDGLYGPYAFGLSGFSETLRSFGGGEAVIGIHGTDTPEALGTDVSNGCIRVDNGVITELAGAIPLGTPVRITD